MRLIVLGCRGALPKRQALGGSPEKLAELLAGGGPPQGQPREVWDSVGFGD